VVDLGALARFLAQLDVLYVEAGRAWIESPENAATLPAGTDVGSPVVGHVSMGSPLVIELVSSPAAVGAEAMGVTVYVLMHLDRVVESLGSSVGRFRQARDVARRRAAQAHVRAELTERAARMYDAALAVDGFAASVQVSGLVPDYAPRVVSFLEEAVEREITEISGLSRHEASGENAAASDPYLQPVEDAAGAGDLQSDPAEACEQSTMRGVKKILGGLDDNETHGPPRSHDDPGSAWD